MNKSNQEKMEQQKRELELDCVIEGCDRGIKRIKKRRVSTILLRKALEDLEDGIDEILNDNGTGSIFDGVPERP